MAHKSGRQLPIENRRREPLSKNPPLKIDMAICINCDACFRACPHHFGAIFGHDIDVIIIPELWSGCTERRPYREVGSATRASELLAATRAEKGESA
jgi:ferredoxin